MVYQGLILLKQTTEDGGQYHHRSHLFTVHWWGEDLADDPAASGGRVRHVASGEAHDFQDWSALVGVLLTMLQGLEDGINTNAKGEERQDAEGPSQTVRLMSI
jgi:hypothetical protein